MKNSVEPSAIHSEVMYVLDGGALIHKVKWIKKGTYLDVVKQYSMWVLYVPSMDIVELFLMVTEKVYQLRIVDMRGE